MLRPQNVSMMIEMLIRGRKAISFVRCALKFCDERRDLRTTRSMLRLLQQKLLPTAVWGDCRRETSLVQFRSSYSDLNTTLKWGSQDFSGKPGGRELRSNKLSLVPIADPKRLGRCALFLAGKRV